MTTVNVYLKFKYEQTTTTTSSTTKATIFSIISLALRSPAYRDRCSENQFNLKITHTASSTEAYLFGCLHITHHFSLLLSPICRIHLRNFEIIKRRDKKSRNIYKKKFIYKFSRFFLIAKPLTTSFMLVARKKTAAIAVISRDENEIKLLA